MSDVKMSKLLKEKKEARNIVKEILNFGVSETQKYEILFNLCLTLENNLAMKNISKVLKNYIDSINNDTDENSVNTQQNKKILTC